MGGDALMDAEYLYSLIKKPVTPDRTTFLSVGKNLFDEATVTTGYYVNNAYGTLDPHASYSASDYIPVKPDTTYTRSSALYMAFYDAGRKYISGIGAGGSKSFTTPSNCSYVRVTITTTAIAGYQLEEGSANTEYEPYGYRVKAEHMPISELISVEDVAFIAPAKNLFDYTKATQGYYVNNVTGVLTADPNYYASDWVSVIPGEKYTSGTQRIAFYSSKGEANFVSGMAYPPSVITIPDGCYWTRFSVLASSYKSFQFARSPIVTASEPFRLALDSKYAPRPVTTANQIRISPIIYAVVNREANVYFDNLMIDNASKYEWDVICDIGKQQDERFTVIPTAAGTKEITFRAFADYEYEVGNAVSSLLVSGASVGTGQTRVCLDIGDSTTAAGTRTQTLIDIADTDVFKVTLIGTKGSGLNKHEGISGWSISQFYSQADSPFVFNGTFDFPQYMTTNNFTAVDRVFINLGTNDVFNFTTDAALQNGADTMITQLEAMITSIKVFNPSVIIGIAATIPPSRHQDAFGSSYQSGNTRWRHKRNIMLWVSRLIAQFSNRMSENIYVVPINIALDTEHNMSRGTETPWNSRTSETVTRQNNGVHPDATGYAQLADMEWAWLKSLEV